MSECEDQALVKREMKESPSVLRICLRRRSAIEPPMELA